MTSFLCHFDQLLFYANQWSKAVLPKPVLEPPNYIKCNLIIIPGSVVEVDKICGVI